MRALVVGAHAVAHYAKPTFEEAWAGRTQGRYGKQALSYLGLRELILAKERAGRPQDLADLDWLRKVELED